MHLKCFKRRRAQEPTDANCAARMKRAKLLLQNFPQSATGFVFFMDEKMFSVASPDTRQDKISGRLQELLKKRFSVFFSAGTAQSAAAWPPVNCACVLQLSEQPTNTTLCPALLRKFICQPLCCVPFQLFAVYPFIYKLFIKILCSSLNTMLIVDKHCSGVCCDEYLMPKIDCKSKQVKEQ